MATDDDRSARAGLLPDGLLGTGADGAPVLIGGWSPTSGHHHFPRADLCPYSGADDVETVELSRSARLWLWTAVTKAPPGYDGPVPYGFGVVELVDEGLRLVTRLTVAEPGRLRAGQPMTLTVEDLPGGLRVWAFAPDDGAGTADGGTTEGSA